MLQAVRAKPDLLDDAVGGVPNGALDEVRQAIKAAVPDPVTENAEEEGSKDAWRKAGWTDAQITAGLANIRSESVTTPQEHMSPAISSFPPGFQQMLSRVFRQSLALDETAERQVVGDGWIQGTAVIRFELILAIQVAPILVKG